LPLAYVLLARAASAVTGVGHAKPEDALALVRSTDIRSSRDARLHCVTQARHLFDDSLKSQGGVSGHVLAKDRCRFALTHDTNNLWPEVCVVIVTASAPGVREAGAVVYDGAIGDVGLVVCDRDVVHRGAAVCGLRSLAQEPGSIAIHDS
jgi:hypothetical protein